MHYCRMGAAVAFAIATLAVGVAQPPTSIEIRRGKIVQLDVDQYAVTLKVGAKDLDLTLTEATMVFNGKGQNLKDRLQGFKVGSEVQFVSREKDGKNYLTHVKLFDAKSDPGSAPPPVDLSKLKPLDELGEKTFEGSMGGFYPDGKNQRPKAHEEAGLRLAAEVKPRGPKGDPDERGKIVLISIGMSNTGQASQGFHKALAAFEGRNPSLVFVNGAQGGMTAARIQSLETPDGAKYWAHVDQQLKKADVTREQVQAVWIKEADAGPTQGFPKYAKTLEAELANIVQILPKRFPNVKLAYLSSRTFAGYAKSRLNPEPYAYESGFSVKWLIERQIQGDATLRFDPGQGTAKAPWLSWGPYLWANGTSKRSDGFSYAESDFAQDGTHLSSDGVEKVGRHILEFFRNDTTSRTWFVASPK